MSQDPIKSRIGKLAVGLAVDCDAAAGPAANILHENLPGASRLPFVGVLTYEGKWVAGYAGAKDSAGFGAFVDEIEKSPKLKAKPAVREQIRKLAAAASNAAKKKNWGAVMVAAATGSELFGRCPERKELLAAETLARDWLKGKFDAVIQDGVSGAKLVKAKKRLLEVQRAFKGLPEAEIAKRGVDAIRRLNRLRAVEARGNPKAGLRESIAKEFAGTPWTAMFARPQQERKGSRAKKK